MPRPACTLAVLSAPLFLESVYEKNYQKYRQSFKQFGSVEPDLGPHCLQTKNDRDDAPTHPPMEIPGILHVNGTRGSSQGGPGPLTIAVFLFNSPPTVKVI